MRKYSISRKTKETEIKVDLDIDGSGKSKIETGIGFLDHMLEQLAKHSMFDITIKAQGDLHIDYHHTTEDSALSLGEAFAKSLGNKKGIGGVLKWHLGGQLGLNQPSSGQLKRSPSRCGNRLHLLFRIKQPAR